MLGVWGGMKWGATVRSAQLWSWLPAAPALYPLSRRAGLRRHFFVRIANEEMAHPIGFEPMTSAFGGQHSIQLSYGCARPSDTPFGGTRQTPRSAGAPPARRT